MAQILNSLVVTEHPEAARALERVMALNLEGYTFNFQVSRMKDVHALERRPDLIFVENHGGLKLDDVYTVTKRFPPTTCVVLDENRDADRAGFMKAGADEVMSFHDLNSPIGRHMLEKLLAFKDLADAETLVARSEERFRSIIENSHDIIMLLDADGSIVYVSPAFRRQNGYEEWEVLGQLFPDFVHEADRGEVRDHLYNLASTPPTTALSMEFQFKTTKGNWLFFEAKATNLLRDDTVQAIVVNMRDVTEQKRAKYELEQYRLHLEALVEKRTGEVADAHNLANTVVAASADALIALKDNGIIAFISEHYRHAYPKAAHALVPGLSFESAYPIVAEGIGLSEFDPRYSEMLYWWRAPKGNIEFRMNNGTWLRLQARRMRDNSGTVISTTNITDYKRQQALLAAQSEELEMALAKEKGIVEQQKTFVSMVSHEFRTPLTIIDGNAQILQSRGGTLDAQTIAKRAGTMRSAVERLVRLIDAILSASMMDSGRMQIDPKPCDIGELLRGTLTDLQDVSPNRKIRFFMRDLPDLMIGDEKMIRQMVTNLVSNALKYSPNGEQVEVKAFGSGNKVIMEVQDRGVGIPEKELPQISTKYFRASTSGGIPGTGLGLSLVKQFVELHKGTFNIRSKVGVGTTVTVTLPLSPDIVLVPA